MATMLRTSGTGIAPWVIAAVLSALSCVPAAAQFLEQFNDPHLKGWTFLAGDGTATMDFRPSEGHASILVDATRDERNLWWAFIRHEISEGLDLGLLNDPRYELRISARVRTSHAPRRVNLHLNTQRTTDFHSHLMEFDIPVAHQWRAISMTTRNFDAVPGDTIGAQLALMDWGLGKYRVDIDDFQVEIVDVTTAGPDQGEPLPYRPPVPPLESFTHALSVVQNGIVDFKYPDMNFAGWCVANASGTMPVLAVGGTQQIILRWDFGALAGKKAAGAGLLELTTYSLERSDPKTKDFGMIRVAEILGGDPQWEQKDVTLNRLAGGRPLDEVFNTQMIIDVDVAEGQGGKTLVTISRPVLQRMLDGKTRGLVIRPLGAIHATFYPAGHTDDAPKLHFSLQGE